MLTLRNDTAATKTVRVVLVRRVVPVERRGRRGEPAAQSLARRMPGGRLHRLPRHRLPRAARALRVSPGEPLRSTASTRTATHSWAATAICATRPPCARAARPTRRSTAGGRLPRWRCLHAAARRVRQARIRDRIRRERAGTTSGRPTARRTSRRRGVCARGCRTPTHVERTFAAHRAPLGFTARTRCRSRRRMRSSNELVNTWNPYQCMVTFHLARSASLFETGRGRGIGFRDSNQDCLGVVHIVPDEVRERLLHLAATQKSDGSAYHQYQPLTRTGNSEIGGGFNDDPLWLVLGVAAYVRETGRAGPARRSRAVRGRAGWRRDDARSPRSVAALHAGAAGRARAAADRPRRLERLPQPERALDAIPTSRSRPRRCGPSGRAESVMIAALFVLAAREYAALAARARHAEPRYRAARRCDGVGRSRRTAGTATGSCARMTTRASRSAATAMPKARSSSSRRRSARWRASARAPACPTRAAECRGAARQRVRRTAARAALPRYHSELGEISTYLPGYKENGSVFCHTNPWVIIAEAMRGRARPRDAVPARHRPDLPDRPGPAPHRTLRVRADGRGPAGRESGRSEEFVADRHRVLVPRRGDAIHPRHARGPRRPRRRSLHSRRTGLRSACAARFRGAPYDIEVAESARRRPRCSQHDRRRQAVVGNVIPLAEPGHEVQVKVELG